MVINFVMSSYVISKIFNDIIKYFKEYSDIKIIITKNPIEKADVYYYFRPHLEKNLMPNSIVTVHHDLEEDNKGLPLDSFLKRYKEAKIIVCLNSKQKDILKSYGIDNTIIIPHGYNDKILKQKKYSFNKKTTIGFFSNYYPRLVKGEDYLLKLFSHLSPSEFEFILVGNKRKLLANDLTNLGFDCKVYEKVPYYIFNKLYNLIDFLLITSTYEGGPACLPEALATGTPILTTQVGMVNDYNKSNNIFILTNNLNDDLSTIKMIHKNKIDIFKSIKMNKNINLLKWKDVVNNYLELFVLVDINSNKDFNLKIKWFLDILKYKLNTLYIKKKLKSFLQ